MTTSTRQQSSTKIATIRQNHQRIPLRVARLSDTGITRGGPS